MTLEAEAFRLPLASWLPLMVSIYAAQVALTAICLRPPRRGLISSGVALLVADLLILALVRWCATAMGGMDYSASFLRWRMYFLALVIVSAGLPLVLWSLALKLTYRPPARSPAQRPLLRPIFQAVVASWVAAGAIILLAGGDFSFLPRPAGITTVEVEILGLAPELDGLRIAALSDHHVGSLMTPRRAARRLNSLSRAAPDLIVELGDVTDMDPSYQPEAVAVIGEHRAPLGSFAVAGNFDVRCGTDALGQLFAEVGVTYLENEAACVSVDGAELWIVGVGDPWTGQDDLEAALADVPAGAPVVLLAHSPDIVEQAAERNIPLMLSGHLHGGQVVIPFAGPVVGMSKYGTRFAWGHFQVGPTHLVVSRGLGEEAIPGRLFCRPEIVLVILRRAPG